MEAKAIVNGKIVSFSLSRGLAAAHRKNKGRCMSDDQAVEYVELKRRQRAKKMADVYFENCH